MMRLVTSAEVVSAETKWWDPAVDWGATPSERRYLMLEMLAILLAVAAWDIWSDPASYDTTSQVLVAVLLAVCIICITIRESRD